MARDGCIEGFHGVVPASVHTKLWQPGYGDCGYWSDVERLQNYQNHLQKNFDKNCTFMGIAMLFVHPGVKAKALVFISEESSADPYPENGVGGLDSTHSGFGGMICRNIHHRGKHWWLRGFRCDSSLGYCLMEGVRDEISRILEADGLSAGADGEGGAVGAAELEGGRGRVQA